MKKKLELYIHIPFCIQKCKYCDFLSGPNTPEIQKAYVDKLIEEIRVQGAFYKEYYVPTIYIGGGTPSVLKGEYIASIMSAIYENFLIEASAEISIEINPGTVDSEKLGFYKQSGINRISIGLQSGSDKELKLLGRIHTYNEFLDCFQKVRAAGFANVNVDLMSAIPGQSMQSLEESIKKIILLKPEHISAYSLILEEGTPFYRYFSTEEGSKHLPDEETERKMYYLINNLLEKAGYKHYEISNYAKKGFESRHNTGYWTGVEYLGLGLGAASYAFGRRFHVEKDLNTYLASDFETDIHPLYRDTEELSLENKMEEFMFLGLRMLDGISTAEFHERFEVDIFRIFGDVIEKNIRKGLLEYKAPMLKLTEQGVDFSNQVMSEFLL